MVSGGSWKESCRILLLPKKRSMEMRQLYHSDSELCYNERARTQIRAGLQDKPEISTVGRNICFRLTGSR